MSQVRICRASLQACNRNSESQPRYQCNLRHRRIPEADAQMVLLRCRRLHRSTVYSAKLRIY